MAFQVTDEHVVAYHRDGCTILRSVLTPGLLSDLRRAAEFCREIARGKEDMHEHQVLRPLGHYPDVDLAPFRHYVEHPPIVEAVKRILGPDAAIPPEDVGILFEPHDAPMCTNWHRDISPELKAWDPFRRRMAMSNAAFSSSMNCALYADSCIGYVPGSHSRPLTPIEARVLASWPDFDAVERDGDPLVMDPIEKELACIETFRAMPNTVAFDLEAGDIVLYASYGLHFAHRAPYRKRATLHHPPRVRSCDDWIHQHVLCDRPIQEWQSDV